MQQTEEKGYMVGARHHMGLSLSCVCFFQMSEKEICLKPHHDGNTIKSSSQTWPYWDYKGEIFFCLDLTKTSTTQLDTDLSNSITHFRAYFALNKTKNNGEKGRLEPSDWDVFRRILILGNEITFDTHQHKKPEHFTVNSSSPCMLYSACTKAVAKCTKPWIK